jgi:hypothetical protein
MAGASADPSTPAVYLAQQYGSTSPNWRIHVAKMLGSVMPDLVATQIQAPPSIAPGGSGNALVTLMNQGDGPMPASQGKLYLSADSVINAQDHLLAVFSIPTLAPNQVTTVSVPFAIPAHQSACDYFAGAVLDTANVASEYSEVNNSNPLQGGDHGNAPMTVIVAETEPNNGAASATMLDLSTGYGAAAGALSPAGDVDYYRFSAPAGSLVWLHVDTGGPLLDPAHSRDSVVTLIWPDGQAVLETDDDDG